METQGEKNTKAYVVRTQGREGIWPSLGAGKARLGWSYDDRLDLRLLQQKTSSGKPLDQEERKAWKGQGFLKYVEIGDYLIYPHQPERGHFAIVEVKGEYQFAPSTDSLDRDFRSYRECQLLTPTPLRKDDAIVRPVIRSKLGNRGRFTRIYDMEAFEQTLEDLPRSGQPEGSGNKIRFSRLGEALIQTIPTLLVQEFPSHEMSRRFARELFEQMGYGVELQEGPTERGSDLVVTIGSPLIDDEFRVGVQVFAYSGSVSTADLRKKLEQLLNGWEENALDYGALLTTGACGVVEKPVVREHNERNPDRRVVLLEAAEISRLTLRHFGQDLAGGAAE